MEATRDLATAEKPIETPLESVTSRVLAQPLVVGTGLARGGSGWCSRFSICSPT